MPNPHTNAQLCRHQDQQLAGNGHCWLERTAKICRSMLGCYFNCSQVSTSPNVPLPSLSSLLRKTTFSLHNHVCPTQPKGALVSCAEVTWVSSLPCHVRWLDWPYGRHRANVATARQHVDVGCCVLTHTTCHRVICSFRSIPQENPYFRMIGAPCFNEASDRSLFGKPRAGLQGYRSSGSVRPAVA